MQNPTTSNDKSEDERKNSFIHSAANKSGAGGTKEIGYVINNTDIKRPEIEFVDMDQEKVQFAFDCAENAIRMLQSQKGDLKYYKDIAQKLKQQFDERYEGCWHVIVGKSFGAYCSYEQNNIILFKVNVFDWKFLIYKFG